jgi:SAM-dependent methyltransferase
MSAQSIGSDTVNHTGTDRALAPGDYSLFRDPEGYLKCREPRGWRGRLKRRSEARALDRCLRNVSHSRTVLDVPAGPGRLFAYWKSRGWHVTAIDMSEEMVAKASEVHGQLGLQGQVTVGDAFDPGSRPPEKADLVASVRFAYYFDRPMRVALWRALAEASNRYVMIHFKVNETLRGKVDALRASPAKLKTKSRRSRRSPRWVISYDDISAEVTEAGLRLVRIVSASEFSYSAFALAERTDASGAMTIDSHLLRAARRGPLMPLRVGCLALKGVGLTIFNLIPRWG